MRHKILNKLKNLKIETTAALYGPSVTKAVFMGHQKSGTTAIANLLSKRSKMSYSNDPVFFSCRESNDAVKLLENKSEEFVTIMRAHRGLFFREVVKDPDFSFAPCLISRMYPAAKIIFISRNPFDIIRSIYNRLGISGQIEAKKIPMSNMKNPTCQWDYIINGEIGCSKQVTERLAARIEETTVQYLKHKDKVTLVKYEEFMSNKSKFIDELADNLGFEKKSDITDYLNKQFQPKGQSEISSDEFFSRESTRIISKACPITLSEFTYI